MSHIFIFSVLVFCLYNCSIPDDENNLLQDFNQSKSTMQAEVDGVLKVCKPKSIHVTPNPNTFNSPLDGIGGSNHGDPNYWFHLYFPVEQGVGSYSIESLICGMIGKLIVYF